MASSLFVGALAAAPESWGAIAALPANPVEDQAEAASAAPNREPANPSSDTAALIPPPLVVEIPAGPRHFHLAPIIGISFPQPVVIGVETSCEGESNFCSRHFRYGWEGGFVPLSLSSGLRKLSIFSTQTGIRYFPSTGGTGWVFGMGLGFRRISFSTDLSAFKLNNEVLASSATLTTSCFFLAPSVGGRWNLTQSLQIAVDVGVQLAIVSSGGLEFVNDRSDRDPAVDLATDTSSIQRLGALKIPQVTLARLIWNLF